MQLLEAFGELHAIAFLGTYYRHSCVPFGDFQFQHAGTVFSQTYLFELGIYN